MDVKDVLEKVDLKAGDSADLSGWIVDARDGLFLLGDHFPENFDHPFRLKIGNGNIIYSILRTVPSLGGGQSLLFYRARAHGVFSVSDNLCLVIDKLFVEGERDSGIFREVDVSEKTVDGFVWEYGDYNFNRSREPMRDWLDDF